MKQHCTQAGLRKNAQKPGMRQTALAAALPVWRWLAYLGIGIVVFGIVFAKTGGRLPDQYASFTAWRDAGDLVNLAIAGVFTGLIVALIKLFLDPVFLGIAERKSKRLIAQQLAVSITQVAVGVAAEGLLGAAASAGSSNEAPSGDFKTGGRGDFGGGGASGNF